MYGYECNVYFSISNPKREMSTPNGNYASQLRTDIKSLENFIN